MGYLLRKTLWSKMASEIPHGLLGFNHQWILQQTMDYQRLPFVVVACCGLMWIAQ